MVFCVRQDVRYCLKLARVRMVPWLVEWGRGNSEGFGQTTNVHTFTYCSINCVSNENVNENNDPDLDRIFPLL